MGYEFATDGERFHLSMEPVMRLCHIEHAMLEEAPGGAGDGAYDLFDQTGSPEDIGKAIADCLKTSDLWSGRGASTLDYGRDLFLTVRIKFCKPITE
jgi:hypothetical protein